MSNNAPVEHCVAEAFILHREIVLTMNPGFTLRAYLTTEVVRESAVKNENGEPANSVRQAPLFLVQLAKLLKMTRVIIRRQAISP